MPGPHSNNIAAPPTGQPAGIAVLEEVLPREISLEGGIEETVSELPTMGKLGVASEEASAVAASSHPISTGGAGARPAAQLPVRAPARAVQVGGLVVTSAAASAPNPLSMGGAELRAVNRGALGVLPGSASEEQVGEGVSPPSRRLTLVGSGWVTPASYEDEEGGAESPSEDSPPPRVGGIVSNLVEALVAAPGRILGFAKRILAREHFDPDLSPRESAAKVMEFLHGTGKLEGLSPMEVSSATCAVMQLVQSHLDCYRTAFPAEGRTSTSTWGAAALASAAPRNLEPPGASGAVPLGSSLSKTLLQRQEALALVTSLAAGGGWAEREGDPSPSLWFQGAELWRKHLDLGLMTIPVVYGYVSGTPPSLGGDPKETFEAAMQILEAEGLSSRFAVGGMSPQTLKDKLSHLSGQLGTQLKILRGGPPMPGGRNAAGIPSSLSGWRTALTAVLAAFSGVVRQYPGAKHTGLLNLLLFPDQSNPGGSVQMHLAKLENAMRESGAIPPEVPPLFASGNQRLWWPVEAENGSRDPSFGDHLRPLLQQRGLFFTTLDHYWWKAASDVLLGQFLIAAYLWSWKSNVQVVDSLPDVLRRGGLSLPYRGGPFGDFASKALEVMRDYLGWTVDADGKEWLRQLVAPYTLEDGVLPSAGRIVLDRSLRDPDLVFPKNFLPEICYLSDNAPPDHRVLGELSGVVSAQGLLEWVQVFLKPSPFYTRLQKLQGEEASKETCGHCGAPGHTCVTCYTSKECCKADGKSCSVLHALHTSAGVVGAHCGRLGHKVKPTTPDVRAVARPPVAAVARPPVAAVPAGTGARATGGGGAVVTPAATAAGGARCSNCGKRGHLVVDCTAPCSICGANHRVELCPNKRVAAPQIRMLSAAAEGTDGRGVEAGGVALPPLVTLVRRLGPVGGSPSGPPSVPAREVPWALEESDEDYGGMPPMTELFRSPRLTPEQPRVVSRGAEVRPKAGGGVPSPPREKPKPAGGGVPPTSGTETWASGAMRCGKGQLPHRDRLFYTNLGPAFLDQGATVHCVTAAQALHFPGGRIVALPSPASVKGADGTTLFVASRTLEAQLTIHYSVNDPERGSSCGLKPTIKEVGLPLVLHIVEDPAFFRNLVPGVPDVSVLLGQGVERMQSVGWRTLHTDYLNTWDTGVEMWTHSQRLNHGGKIRGSSESPLVVHPSANALDVGDVASTLSLDYPPRYPFELDSEMEDEEPVSTGTTPDDRGASELPTTLEGMAEYLASRIPGPHGRVTKRYIPLLAELFLSKRDVLLQPRPSTKAPPMDIRTTPGAPPTRAGLSRRVPKEAIPALNTEIEKLIEGKLVERVPLDGGKIPLDLWVNGLVVTARRVTVVNPEHTRPAVRVCIDPAANAFSADSGMKTRLPNLEQHVAATNGCSLFSGLDAPNAFHQCALTEEGKNLFGFCVPDRTGVMAFYRYTGCPFGFHSLPGLFQERMEAILAGACEAGTTSVAQAFIDDTLICTAGRNGTRLSDVWGEVVPTPQETEIVTEHIRVLGRALDGYLEYGMVVKLTKCELLREEIGVCGILCDGLSRRIDPSRVDGWANLGQPERVSLEYIQMLLGVANYCAPFLPVEYMKVSEPLFALARETCRAVSLAGTDKVAKREALSLPRKLWNGEHDSAVVWIVHQIQHSQTRYFLDFSRPIHLVSDASDTGVAALLGQYDTEGRFRICYTLSKRFTAQQKLYSVGAREVLGWVIACRAWGKILAFGEVIFESDHHNLVTSVEDMNNIHLARWCLELSSWNGFTKHRVHRRGEPNIICDVLSRCAAVFTLHQKDELATKRFSPILAEAYFPELLEAPQVHSVAETAVVRKLAAAGGGGEREAVVDVFENPHTHCFSPFILSVLEAQEKLDLETRTAYMSMTSWQVTEKALGGKHVLLAKGRLLVPEDKGLLNSVFEMVHDKALHASEGVVLEKLVRAKLFVPYFQKNFGEYYASCSCQHARSPQQLMHQGPNILGPTHWPLAHVSVDFASLPMTEEGGAQYVGAFLIVDAASRCVQITAVKDKKAATAVECLQRWCRQWGTPIMVHCDCGSHFTGTDFVDFLVKENIAQDLGTPHHSRGRGLVERMVGKMKDGLKRLIPQGRLASWPKFMGELEKLVNRMPHRSLGGESPFDYLILGHRNREERFVVARDVDHPEGRVFENWTMELGHPTPQRVEDLALVLSGVRQVADICSEISSLKASITSEEQVPYFDGKVGDWVLRYAHERENSLEALYQGPYQITKDLRGDFYTIAEVLAGDNLGKEVEVHSSRLVRFNRSRTSGNAEHVRKLPEGYRLVDAILEGPREGLPGKVLVKWWGLDAPTWEHVGGLRDVLKYKQFCTDHGLTLDAVPKKVRAPPGKAAAVVRLLSASAGSLLGSVLDPILPVSS